jgi:hypothetical protein
MEDKNMKKSIIVFVFALLASGCTNESTNPIKLHSPTKVIVEGSVYYFVGGGTVEIQLPEGYQLRNSKWISPSTKSDTGFSIYLSGSIDPSYLNKRGQAFGTLDSIPVIYMVSNSYSGYVWEIHVDSLRVID